MPIFSRLKTAWNAFVNTESQAYSDYTSGAPSFTVSSPSRPRRRYSNERTIISSIFNRMSNDVAAVSYRHIKVDDEDRYLEDIKSHLNYCFTLEANLDQGPRAFRQDIALTLFDKGVAAIVPVDTSITPGTSDILDIYTLRVGDVVAWYPKHVKVSLYNEEKGKRQDILLEKRFVAIVENPWYAVMNEPNSTLQRLIRKLSLLDIVDEQSSSGKLDIIIQLPYVIKSEARKQQAEQRREDIEFQLKGSKYGIAYTDGTEKITQLNRPAENNLLKTVEFLQKLLYEQLGITDEIMSGTADEKTMTNYYNRTVEPILDAIIEAMQRSFLGLTRTMKNERIKYYDNPFKFVPMEQMAEIADKFSRNEIFSPNDIRGFMGVKPSKDPKAEELNNSNMPSPPVVADTAPMIAEMDKAMNGVFDGLAKDVEKIAGGLRAS